MQGSRSRVTELGVCEWVKLEPVDNHVLLNLSVFQVWFRLFLFGTEGYIWNCSTSMPSGSFMYVGASDTLIQVTRG